MQNDDITWSIINKSFCSYKIKTPSQSFCKNVYNLAGLCSRKACPLANSQYATIREEKGVCHLYIRTVERSMFPNKQWEKIELSSNYKKARKQVAENLLFWNHYFVQKCQQRLTKITQYLLNMRKLKLKGEKNVVVKKTRIERGLKKKEKKALIAARIDNVIEKKLMEKLEAGTYERIYNYPRAVFRVSTAVTAENRERETNAVQEEELEEQEEFEENNMDRELVAELERDADTQFSDYSSENDSDDEDISREFVEDFDESEDDIEDAPGPSKRK